MQAAPMQVMMYTLGDEIAALRSQRRVSEWALANFAITIW
ncbi:MAG: hypothetical protein ACI89U_003254 [Gammaproteobacteria bacterium]